MTQTVAGSTVERFLEMARVAILDTADLKPEERAHLESVKVTYGMGNGTYRGITAFGAWKLADETETETTDFVEIAATGQESWIQLAGTLLHEMGHSLAGMGVGHGKAWKDSCVRLGFVKRPEAAGQRYWLSLFRPQLRQALYVIARELRDGTPNFWSGLGGTRGTGTVGTARGCRAGQGIRGGTSRGTGSGSRLRLWECHCDKPVKVRIASDDFQATCKVCGTDFERK